MHSAKRAVRSARERYGKVKFASSKKGINYDIFLHGYNLKCLILFADLMLLYQPKDISFDSYYELYMIPSSMANILIEYELILSGFSAEF